MGCLFFDMVSINLLFFNDYESFYFMDFATANRC